MTLSLSQQKTELIVAASSYSSILTLYTYDYLLNLSREVTLMWPGPFHLATLLYFSTRYLPFVKLVYDLGTVFLSAGNGQSSKWVIISACAIGLHIVDVFHILSRTSITVVLFVQTYAVYNQSRIILATLGPSGLALIVLDGIESVAKSCTLIDPSARAFYSTAYIDTTVSLVILTVFPTAVMLLTFYRVFAIMRHQNGFRRESMTKGSGLTNLILFQTLCMSGVCVLRLFNALWFLFGPTAANLGVNPFTLPAAAVFISHFLLSLRDVKDAEDEPGNGSSNNNLALTTIPLPIWIDPPGFEIAETFAVPPLWEEAHDGRGSTFGRLTVERWTADFRRG